MCRLLVLHEQWRAARFGTLALLALFSGCAGKDGGADPPRGEWFGLAPMPGGARQETAVVALDGEVVVLGGIDGDLQVVATVETYDPSTDTWDTLPDLPNAMHHANAAVANGKIVIAGFLTTLDFLADDRVYVYTPGGSWIPKTTMPNGTGRGASGVAVIDDKVYVVGGLREGAAVAHASVYDLSDDAWTELADLPEARDHLGAAAIDGVVYAVGGRNGTIESHVARLDRLFPDGGWATLEPMPTSRGGIAVAAFDGLLFVFGGEGNADHESGVFDQVEAYDPADDAWETFVPMQTRRHGTGAAVVGSSRIYVPGGADEEALSAVDVNEAFEPF